MLISRFDPYLIRYITEFLKQCVHCKKFDYLSWEQSCEICKKFYCPNCKHKLIRNGNNYETTSNYCSECNQKYFR